MPDQYQLKISAIADQDLKSIYEYGFNQWGEQQADQYFDALIAHFQLLCDNPFLYAAVDEVRPGYRRSVCGAHSIYYRVIQDYIEVMAIIGKQDVESVL